MVDRAEPAQYVALDEPNPVAQCVAIAQPNYSRRLRVTHARMCGTRIPRGYAVLPDDGGVLPSLLRKHGGANQAPFQQPFGEPVGQPHVAQRQAEQNAERQSFVISFR